MAEALLSAVPSRPPAGSLLMPIGMGRSPTYSESLPCHLPT